MLEEVKFYLRVDGDEEDASIQSLIDASKEYLRNTDVVERDSNLYRLAIKMLVSHWYENREIVGKDREIPYGFKAIVTQLRYESEVV
jgi:uncharacterized phage protein (predicted DNA packaging)